MNTQPSDNIIPLNQPKRFIPPTLEAVLIQAAKCGLPEPQAQLYFAYNQARNWMIGKSMTKNWHASMTVWRLKWLEGTSRLQQPSASMQLMVNLKALERIEARIELLRKRNGNSGWPAEDLTEIANLKRRRNELRGVLGFLA